MQVSTKAMLGDLSAGYKKPIGKLKQNGEMSMTKGKVPLTNVGTFQAYNFLARKALAITTDFLLAMFAQKLLSSAAHLLCQCQAGTLS